MLDGDDFHVAFEADEVLRVLGEERGIDRMGRGGNQDVHRPRTDRASSAFNKCAKISVTRGDSLIDRNRTKGRLHVDE